MNTTIVLIPEISSHFFKRLFNTGHGVIAAPCLAKGTVFSAEPGPGLS
jgi:hypothetical protein